MEINLNLFFSLFFSLTFRVYNIVYLMITYLSNKKERKGR